MSALQKTDLTPDQLKTLAQAGVIPADTPMPIVQIFAEACRMHDLSPITKEIYLVKYNTKNGPMYHTIVGIDGIRKKAQRTGQYAGLDDLKFNVGQRGEFQTISDLKIAGKMPVSCTATVYRVVGGVRCPFTKTVVFDEFAQGSNPKWQQMPWQMIGKVAEMFALKAAFGDEMSGLHIEDERAAFEEVTIRAEEVRPQLNAELEKAREHCKTIFEQCRYEEQQGKFMETRINTSEDIAELRSCYATMRDHVDELQSMDPASKRVAR
jgi:phage recombination protein Bet